jgi:hypothetical protein
MTRIYPKLVCYAGRKRSTFVELYCLLRAHPFLITSRSASLTPSSALPLAKALAIMLSNVSFLPYPACRPHERDI